jgi:uncharacterized membrane protein YtjA (UPF0391 family)
LYGGDAGQSSNVFLLRAGRWVVRFSAWRVQPLLFSILYSLAIGLHLTARGGNVMLWYAWVFLVIAIIAAIFGFGGIAAGAAGIAKILFFVFLVVFLISLFTGRRTVV